MCAVLWPCFAFSFWSATCRVFTAAVFILLGLVNTEATFPILRSDLQIATACFPLVLCKTGETTATFLLVLVSYALFYFAAETVKENVAKNSGNRGVLYFLDTDNK